MNLVRALLTATLVVGAAGCAGTGGSTPHPARGSSIERADADRVAGWRGDLALLVPAMSRLHPELDHGTPLPVLDAAAEDLAARAPTLTDDQLFVGVMRIVALVSAAGCDGHTGVFAWGAGMYPVTSLPLRLWVFDDGIRIVDAIEPAGDLVGARIERVDSLPIADVRAALEPLIPRDNDQTVRLLLPRFLLMPEVLRGLGLAGPGPIQLGLTLPDGSSVARTLDPIAMADYNAWAGPYGLHLPADPDVPYLARIGDLLWWDRSADGTLVIQWNRVERVGQADLGQIRAAAADSATERMVLDLRHNYGGEVSALGPLADLVGDPSIDRPGRLFVVTGRNTFSAASLLVARLDADTTATIVGEPMGGCPTAWGDADPLRLPFSGIEVSVSRRLEVGVSPDDRRPTIEPAVPAPLTFEAWAAGTDPALQAIQGSGG